MPLTLLCLVAALASPPVSHAAPGKAPEPGLDPMKGKLETIDARLHRQEWAAAEAEIRSLLAAELKEGSQDFRIVVPRLALAEAGQGRQDDALWHWQIAQNLEMAFDPKPFGPPGELLASHPLRHLDEVPAGLTVRRPDDGGAAFSPPRQGEEKSLEVPAAWQTVPKGIRVQAIVDAQGRVEQPVVAQSTSPAFTYAVLEAIRGWRFEPARVGGEPVAAFYELTIPSTRRPLVGLVDFTGSPLAEPEATLRAGRYEEAGRQIGKIWRSSLDSSAPSQGFLGVALALKALAQAGTGEPGGAICRWQAAQTLETHLYGADLTAYGAAGALLGDHGWGERFDYKTKAKSEDGKEGVHRPEILKRRDPLGVGQVHAAGVHGTIVVEGTITTTGEVRNLHLLKAGLPVMAASILDAVCDWRFKPAMYRGEPVPVYYSLSFNF